MSNLIKIAIAQINSIVGDVDGNSQKILSYINNAYDEHADIVAFPELALSGYPPEDLLLKTNFLSAIYAKLEYIVSKTPAITVVLGFPYSVKKNVVYNSAAVIKNKKILGIYKKKILPNYGVFDEKRYFTSGDLPFVFKEKDKIIEINICEDMWSTEYLKTRKDVNTDLIINISSSPYHYQKQTLRKEIIKSWAKEKNSYVCYVNNIGGQDELVFDGSSMIMAPNAKDVISAKEFEEDLLLSELTFPYQGFSDIGKKSIKHDEIARTYAALCLGLKDYITKNGFNRVVIGLSGGIDSALTAAIARDALGAQNVIGVSMPSQYSSDETKSDARKLAENLDLEFHEITIKNLYNEYLKSLKTVFSGAHEDVTEENIQARIRGNILMALSNKYGHLVLSTGNKSEISCGYCTLYGDMAGGFSVLKDVSKTLVYELAKYYNLNSGEISIPNSIIIREPSAELRENQKDSDSLPPYDILDDILKKYIEKNLSISDIISSSNYDPDIVKKIINMVDKNEYKRRQSPIGINISPKSFGRDRRFPITNLFTS